MSYSIMEALFDGRVIPWERRCSITDEHRRIEAQIQREKRYFIEKMSLEDCQRLEQLESLYFSAAHCEEVDTYSHGFTLGALLMAELLEKKEAMARG